jgi:hypothetical protein
MTLLAASTYERKNFECLVHGLLGFLQDAWCVQERLAGQDMVMFGVFDGHGQEGKTVSHSVCTNVPKFLTKQACKVGSSLH